MILYITINEWRTTSNSLCWQADSWRGCVVDVEVVELVVTGLKSILGGVMIIGFGTML
jgi:hypothetical protein